MSGSTNSGYEQLKLEALRKCAVEIVKNMNPDAVKGTLYANRMLTDDELERLGLPVMTTRDKNFFILQKLPSKGLRAFDYFIEALRSTAEENPAHNELAELLLSKVLT